jgi:hypothetical protein
MRVQCKSRAKWFNLQSKVTALHGKPCRSTAGTETGGRPSSGEKKSGPPGRFFKLGDLD